MNLTNEVLVKMLRVSPLVPDPSLIKLQLQPSRETAYFDAEELVNGMASGQITLNYGGRVILHNPPLGGLSPQEIDIALSYYLHLTYLMMMGNRDDVYRASYWLGASGTQEPNPFSQFGLVLCMESELTQWLPRIFEGGMQGGAYPDMWVVKSVPSDFLNVGSIPEDNVAKVGGVLYRMVKM